METLFEDALFLAVFIGLAVTAGRAWAYGALAVPLVAALYIHLVWLPKHGINRWTAEPYDKYLELMRSRGHV